MHRARGRYHFYQQLHLHLNLDYNLRSNSHNHKRQSDSDYGDYVAVIAGNSWDYGEDSGEIVIHDPIVIEILA